MVGEKEGWARGDEKITSLLIKIKFKWRKLYVENRAVCRPSLYSWTSKFPAFISRICRWGGGGGERFIYYVKSYIHIHAEAQFFVLQTSKPFCRSFSTWKFSNPLSLFIFYVYIFSTPMQNTSSPFTSSSLTCMLSFMICIFTWIVWNTSN